MENDVPWTSPGNAANQLQGYADVRARVEQRGPSRWVALLLLWDALAMAAFMGAVLASYGGRGFEDAAMDSAVFSMWLLLLPILVLRSLIRGAQEKFSVRKKSSPAYWSAYALITSACLILLVADFTYAWWMNLLMPALLFVVMAVGPIRQLRSTRASAVEPLGNEPLSRATRWTTVLIGVAMGVLIVVGTQDWLPTLSLAVTLVLIIGALFSRRLPRAGAEWGSTHWAAFGIVMGLLFVLFVLMMTTSWVTALISIAAGALALIAMLLAAFRPFPASDGV